MPPTRTLARHTHARSTHIDRTCPPWSQPRGNSMVSSVNSHTNATRIGWHLWEIYLRFAPGLPPGWIRRSTRVRQSQVAVPQPLFEPQRQSW